MWGALVRSTLVVERGVEERQEDDGGHVALENSRYGVQALAWVGRTKAKKFKQ